MPSVLTAGDYDRFASENGWTITRGISVQGLPCTVYQRGNDEVAVHVPAPEGSPPERAVATVNGQSVEADLANFLLSSPRKHTLTSHIYTNREGIIAELAARQAERLIQARSSITQREGRRLRDEAAGLDLAISILQSWEERPAPTGMDPFKETAGQGKTKRRPFPATGYRWHAENGEVTTASPSWICVWASGKIGQAGGMLAGPYPCPDAVRTPAELGSWYGAWTEEGRPS